VDVRCAHFVNRQTVKCFSSAVSSVLSLESTHVWDRNAATILRLRPSTTVCDGLRRGLRLPLRRRLRQLLATRLHHPCICGHTGLCPQHRPPARLRHATAAAHHSPRFETRSPCLRLRQLGSVAFLASVHERPDALQPLGICCCAARAASSSCALRSASEGEVSRGWRALRRQQPACEPRRCEGPGRAAAAGRVRLRHAQLRGGGAEARAQLLQRRVQACVGGGAQRKRLRCGAQRARAAARAGSRRGARRFSSDAQAQEEHRRSAAHRTVQSRGLGAPPQAAATSPPRPGSTPPPRLRRSRGVSASALAWGGRRRRALRQRAHPGRSPSARPARGPPRAPRRRPRCAARASERAP
jgi:hypothetical protein